jgi:glycerol-3-phosphate cytidylyltransferase-like family protein
MLKYLVRNGQTFYTHCGRSSDTIDKKKGMHIVPTNVEMEKGKVQEVVSEEVITKGKNDKFQYLEDEDVDIIAIQEPFHQQLEKELLMQPKEGEQTKKIQQEEEVQQKEEELHARALILMD